MAKRIKPHPYIVENLQQAEGALAEIAALDRKIQDVNSSMQELIDLEKTKASQLCTPLVARRKEIADGIAIFARLNKQELFAKTKSRDLGFGVIGFRSSTKMVQQNGVTAEMTIQRLQRFGLLTGIRTKYELNKDAMAAWPDERLESLGLKRQQSETFFIEIAKDEIPTKNTLNG